MLFRNNIEPVLFEIGPIDIRWYGVFVALGVYLSYRYLKWIFKREGYPVIQLDSLIIYAVVGSFLGGKLGHVLLGHTGYFLEHPTEIFMLWRPGLSSHGAALGIAIAVLLWTRIHKLNFARYASLLALGFPLIVGFVRLGNFCNSEIIGKPTGTDWGVVFLRLGEDFPRHPVQLYEAALAFVVFVILFGAYRKYYRRAPEAMWLFLSLLFYFSSRFLVDFWKEHQLLADDLPLSMGQVLSIFPVVISIGYFGWLFLHRKSGGDTSSGGISKRI